MRQLAILALAFGAVLLILLVCANIGAMLWET